MGPEPIGLGSRCEEEEMPEISLCRETEEVLSEGPARGGGCRPGRGLSAEIAPGTSVLGSGFQNHQEINVCCLTQQSEAFCYNGPSRFRPEGCSVAEEMSAESQKHSATNSGRLPSDSPLGEEVRCI